MNLQVASPTREVGEESGAHTLNKLKKLYKSKNNDAHISPHPQLSTQIRFRVLIDTCIQILWCQSVYVKTEFGAKPVLPTFQMSTKGLTVTPHSEGSCISIKLNVQLSIFQKLLWASDAKTKIYSTPEKSSPLNLPEDPEVCLFNFKFCSTQKSSVYDKQYSLMVELIVCYQFHHNSLVHKEFLKNDGGNKERVTSALNIQHLMKASLCCQMLVWCDSRGFFSIQKLDVGILWSNYFACQEEPIRGRSWAPPVLSPPHSSLHTHTKD